MTDNTAETQSVRLCPKCGNRYPVDFQHCPVDGTKLAEDKPNYPDLVNCLEGLERIAQNNSDGIPAIINLSYDSLPQPNKPASYYWYIMAIDRATGKEYRVMNGGIIAHANRDNSDEFKDLEWYERPITGYSYSTHT